MRKSAAENFREWLERSLNDPLIKALLENSHLTEAQFETFLIDVLSERYHHSLANSGAKVKLRSRGEVSRGAFNRTRDQALRNIIRSIYTILLLGCVGVFDTPRLDPFVELGQKLDSYVKSVKARKEAVKHEKIVKLLEEELIGSIRALTGGRGKP